MLEIKTIKDIVSKSIQKHQIGTDWFVDNMDRKFVSVKSLEKFIDETPDGLFTDRNWKKVLKQQLKQVAK